METRDGKLYLKIEGREVEIITEICEDADYKDCDIVMSSNENGSIEVFQYEAGWGASTEQ